MSKNQNEGWEFTDTATTEWQSFGDGSKYKVIGAADGFVMVLAELPAGASGNPHQHEAPEFLYVLEGEVTSNGVEMQAGHGYSAPAGTEHVEFVTKQGCQFISVFKLG